MDYQYNVVPRRRIRSNVDPLRNVLASGCSLGVAFI